MTKYGQPDTHLLLNGYNISGNTFELTTEVEELMEQTDGFGDAWFEQSPVGVAQASISHRSFYDDVALGTYDAIVNTQGTAQVLSALMEGDTQNKRVVCFADIIAMKMVRAPVRAELTKIASEYATDRSYEGTVVQEFGVAEAGDGETSLGSFTYVPPIGTDEVGTPLVETSMIGFLQVLSLTLGGYTSVTIKIRDSTDDIAFVDLITFTAVTAAQVAEAVIAVGVVDTYVNCELTWNGAGAAESINFLAALAVEAAA